MIKQKTSVKTIRENEDYLLKNIDPFFSDLLFEFEKDDNWYKVLKDCYLGTSPKDRDKLICKHCGKLNRNYRFDFCKRQCMYSYNMNHYGKKRPEHSKKILEHFSNGTYEKFRATNNINMNTSDFKKIRLTNHRIDFDDTNFEEKYTQLLRDVQAGPEHWRRTLLSSIKIAEWKEYQEYFLIGYDILTEELINNMTEEELREWYARYNSLKTTIAYENNPSMGRTKSERLEGLEFNKRGLTSIYIRSSYEKNWVLFFEENKIQWDYECFKMSDGDILYVPDFFITMNDKEYIIEVKGFVPESWVDAVYKKALLGVQYTNDNNMYYCFSFDSTPKSSQEYFDSIVLNEKDIHEIRNVIQNNK